MRSSLLLAAVVPFVLAGSVAAQSAPRGSFEGLVEVSEVFLDVLVTDASGQPVAGLEEEDFHVEENGAEVRVTGVDYYSTRYDGLLPSAANEVPASRYFLVFFDDQTRYGYYGRDLLRQQLRAAADLTSWVRDGMAPSDWVAVVSHAGSLRVHHDFTQDREAIVAAVASAAAGRAPTPWARARGGGARPFTLGVLDRLPRGGELERATGDVHDALRRVAEVCGYLVGRKSLLLYTTGFGREVGGQRIVVPDPAEYPELEAALNDHNVAVYPIDLTPAGRPPRQPQLLQRLAEDTGGAYEPDFVGFRSPVDRVAAENVGYYLLSYQTQHAAGAIGYQRVDVRVDDAALLVRARRGYRYGL